MQTILNIIQIVISVFLVATILFQQRGTGLGSAFGGGGGDNAYRTKRGFDKILFFATIVFACIFIISAFLRLIL